MLKTICAFLLLVTFACAQEAPAAPPSTSPSAAPADVKSVDAILSALYDVISGPAGKPRDWDRFRSLFATGARLIPIAAKKEGGYEPRVLSPDEFATRSQAAVQKQGFFEHEISRRTHRWANIAEVFSVYESRRAADDPQPFARGINSLQLMYDGGRWWIVSIMWQAENDKVKLPARLLRPEPRGQAQEGQH